MNYIQKLLIDASLDKEVEAINLEKRGLHERAAAKREGGEELRAAADELEAAKSVEPVAWQLRKLPDGDWMIPTPAQESHRHIFDAWTDYETRDLYPTSPTPQVPHGWTITRGGRSGIRIEHSPGQGVWIYGDKKGWERVVYAYFDELLAANKQQENTTNE